MKKSNHMKRAFTLIELIFVIVLLGVLSGVAIFYFRSDGTELVQATNQLARHIRYTQHLALMDDKFIPNPNPSHSDWYKGRWQIFFHKSGLYPATQYVYYDIFSDSKDPTTGYGGGVDSTSELAIDPFDKTKLGTLNSATKSEKDKLITNLVAQYSVEFDSTCGNQIIFDTIGRPYTAFSDTNPYANLLNSNCTITLRHMETDETSMIIIHPESGFVETTIN